MFKGFPSIEQYRHVIKNVAWVSQYQGTDETGKPVMSRTAIKPKLVFKGSVKLHGTNASVVVSKGMLQIQSRERIITPEEDNAGFAKFIHRPEIFDYFKQLSGFSIFGEWCGGSIQQGVALSGLPKMFVIFAIRDDSTDAWLIEAEIREVLAQAGQMPTEVKFIYDFQTWEIEIDFENPAKSQNQMVEITQQVENECPVGKALGSIGTGEGVVWKCEVPNFTSDSFWFKVKGKKHSVSKVTTLAAVDPEVLRSIEEFVEYAVTENRLKQGLDYLTGQQLEHVPENLGTFIKWLMSDVVKEESDTLAESGLEPKQVAKQISAKARQWFLSRLK